jgi:hypothetical protein
MVSDGDFTSLKYKDVFIVTSSASYRAVQKAYIHVKTNKAKVFNYTLLFVSPTAL